MVAVCGLSLLLLARLGARFAMAGQPAPFAVAHRVDLRTAGVAELMALEGVGRRRAEAIVLDRLRHGPLRSLDELVRVDGIGPATVEALRPFVVDPAAAGADR